MNYLDTALLTYLLLPRTLFNATYKTAQEMAFCNCNKTKGDKRNMRAGQDSRRGKNRVSTQWEREKEEKWNWQLLNTIRNAENECAYNNNLCFTFTCTKNAMRSQSPLSFHFNGGDKRTHHQRPERRGRDGMMMRANCVKLFFNCVLPVISNFIVIFYFSITS